MSALSAVPEPGDSVPEEPEGRLEGPDPAARSVTVRAAAKVNLCLGVGPARADGFHELATVYQAIGLYDDLTATPAESWSIHTVADPYVDAAAVPDDETNLAVRAGKALLAHHGLDGQGSARAAHLEVRKGIPVAGGLAGGSADAAAALVALDRLYGLGTPDADLLDLAGALGSDVPFALVGGTAEGTGHGEVVRPVEAAAQLWWLVVPHEVGVSTPAVYRRFDELGGPGRAAFPEGLLDALRDGDAAGAIARLANDLAEATYSLRPDLRTRAASLAALTGNPVLLSGSGPTQLLPFAEVEAARAAARALTAAGIVHWLAPGHVAGAHVL